MENPLVKNHHFFLLVILQRWDPNGYAEENYPKNIS